MMYYGCFATNVNKKSIVGCYGIAIAAYSGCRNAGSASCCTPILVTAGSGGKDGCTWTSQLPTDYAFHP